MPFKRDVFLGQNFVAREEEVKLEALKDWFDEGEEPIFKVRGLSGKELGRANVIAQRNKQTKAVIDGLFSQNSREITAAIKTLISPETPEDVAKRIAYLEFGAVEPKIDTDFALKLCENFPIEFSILSNKILELTGKGSIVGELKASGETQ